MMSGSVCRWKLVSIGIEGPVDSMYLFESVWVFGVWDLGIDCMGLVDSVVRSGVSNIECVAL